jgi:hypothetical protein
VGTYVTGYVVEGPMKTTQNARNKKKRKIHPRKALGRQLKHHDYQKIHITLIFANWDQKLKLRCVYGTTSGREPVPKYLGDVKRKKM